MLYIAILLNMKKAKALFFTVVLAIFSNAESIKRALTIPLLFETCVPTPPFVPPIQLPRSCLEVQQNMPGSSSGIFSIDIGDNTTIDVYCNMETLCGSEGGWTRLAFLNMTDATENCPSTLRLYEVDGVRACGRTSSGVGSCSSVQYPSYGINYTQICGRARGYQFHGPDAIDPTIGASDDINFHYVDGLSLTRGNPRQHVWTYIAGVKEDNSITGQGLYTCPCQTGSHQTNMIPLFIGNDYYCESGNPVGLPLVSQILYTDDPLWDGKQCNGLEPPCCTSPNLPWFHKVLDSPTNDYIEARVCGDQTTSDEDVPIEQLEVYVK